MSKDSYEKPIKETDKKNLKFIMNTTGYDIIKLNRMIEASGDVCPVLVATDKNLCQTYADVMVRLFNELTVQEHKNPSQFDALKEAYRCTAHGAMKYLDDSGVTAAVSSVAPLFENFSFAENASALAFEATFIHKMGVPYEKITPFWSYVDHNKSEFIKQISKPGFTLECLVDPAVSDYGTEVGGEKWEHLSPGFWRRMVGFAIGVVNVTAAVPTCGVAVASVIVGGIGVAAG